MNEPSTSSQGYNTSSSINMLNDYVLHRIFQHLALRDRVRMERVCKQWKEASMTSWSNCKALILSSFAWHECNNKIAFQELLLRCGKYVQHLKFPYESISFCREAIDIVIKFCPNLKYINIALIPLNAPEICKLITKYRNLKEITIGVIESIHCEQLLRKWYINNKNLYALKLTSCVNVSGESLLYLPKTLRVLIIHDTQVETRYLIQALKNFDDLKHLILDYYFGWHDVVNIVHEHCRNLETLNILAVFNPYGTNSSIMNITNIETLRCLILWNNIYISDEFLNALTLNCQQLVCLDISNCTNVTDNGLRYLIRLSYLRYLFISRISTITARPLYELSNLEILHCRGNNQFNDNNLVKLVEFLPNLKLLDMSYCFEITDHGIRSAIEIASSRINNIKLKIKCTKRFDAALREITNRILHQ